uniref:Uncharacterized protein n=1 Tax=Tanacetum cinerariifolium TaxID=118510 RepID=A0A6L2MN74_TANCI|nr:hypothetical protein [Tanacetum cinerariifolium]
MGGFHLFADVAKYGRTNNRLEERSGDIKPNEGMNTQPVRDNANVFQSFNSYAKAVLGNKSVGVSGSNDASNSGEKPVGVSVSNTANEESSTEALMFISEDDCIDLDGMERSILAKVKDLSVTEGFIDVGLRYVGGRWVWLEFDSTDQFPPTDRSDFTHEEFADELAHIISPPEYDCFYFRNLPDPGEWIPILNFEIRENLSSTTRVNLPVEDDHSPLLALEYFDYIPVSVGIQTSDDLSRSPPGFIEKMGIHG